jgi:AraC-like ligand binding domain
MKPDLEVVQIGHGQSFKAWEHGYPFHTVRWHFHPEMEIHQVAATSGHYYVGDFIGEFVPGNLVLTGPNLPHNWISHVPDGATVPLRSRVVQFPEDLLQRIAELFPDTGGFAELFQLSRRGVLFSDAASDTCAPILAELVQARGPRRASLFLDLLATIAADGQARCLASDTYLPDPSGLGFLAQLSQAYGDGRCGIRQPAADQSGLPDVDERHREDGDGHLLCGGFQQPFELQPSILATKGNAAQPVPRAARRQSRAGRLT